MDGAIRLRAVEAPDLAAFFAHQVDPVAWHMVAFAAKEPRERAAFDEHWRKLLADPAIVVRTITCAERVVGHILCFPRGNEFEVGYWVAREAWGRGIATAALGQLLVLVPQRPLVARCAKDNVGSARVLARVGFSICREERWLSHARGGEIDELVWVLQAPLDVAAAGARPGPALPGPQAGPVRTGRTHTADSTIHARALCTGPPLGWAAAPTR